MGDTVFYSQGFLTLDKVDVNPNNAKYQFSSSDTALMADITVYSKDGQSYKAAPVFAVKNNAPLLMVDSVFSQNLVIAFVGLEDKKVKLQVKESDTVLDFITIKAYKFPFINLVWIGTMLTVLGLVISMFHRRRQGRVSRKSLRIIKPEEKEVEV